jgi:hypothetical protein
VTARACSDILRFVLTILRVQTHRKPGWLEHLSLYRQLYPLPPHIPRA